MALIGYSRVSTDGQSLAAQDAALQRSRLHTTIRREGLRREDRQEGARQGDCRAG